MNQRVPLPLICMFLLTIAGSSGFAESAASEGFELEYYSDYFSFVGKDDQGWVAFALDNNRGREGLTFQAEHFLVLHEEKQHWVPVQGNGAYLNEQNELLTIPNSPAFTFQGSRKSGFEIVSIVNHLTLSTESLRVGVQRTEAGGEFWMGSASATLNWKGRMIKGRVIYEYIYKSGFNRLVRSYPNLFRNFHGLYCAIDSGSGDFYFHDREGWDLLSLTGKRVGFLNHAGSSSELKELQVKVNESEPAKGDFQWPVSWTGAFQYGEKTVEFDLKLHDRNVIGYFEKGGFSMGIIKGNLKTKDREYEVYGLGELLI